MVEGDQPDGEDLRDVEVEDQVLGVVGCEGRRYVSLVCGLIQVVLETYRCC